MTTPGPMTAAAYDAATFPDPHPPGRATPAHIPPARPDLEHPWEALVRQARDGDPQAFTALVDAFGPRVLGYLQRLTRHAQDAEDLTQETFLKAHRMLPGFNTPRAFPAWLFTIARRTALNHFRGLRHSEPVDPELPTNSPDPAQSASSRDTWRHLWTRARDHLKPAQFEVLWFRYAEELSVTEIARVTGRSSIHVRVLLHRGRNALLSLVRQPISPLPEA